MAATLFDICKASRVSTATVSRVVNGSPLVKGKTRARVLAAIKRLDYHPNYAARALAGHRTSVLGVIFPEIANGFYTEVLRGIDEVAAEHQFHLLTVFAHGRQDEQELVLRFLRDRRADALLVMDLLLSDDLLDRGRADQIPIVLIDRPVADASRFAVSLDNVGGAEAAMAHLLAHGYPDLAVLTGPPDNYDAQQRRAGCLRALAQAGVRLSEDAFWPGLFTEASGRLLMERRLHSGRPLPRAIFSCNDAMALGALAVLREHGYRVPEDVALMGFDDSEPARHVGLTTVRVPMQALGRAAAEGAIKQVLNHETSAPLVLPTRLVVRDSCGCRGAADGNSNTKEPRETRTEGQARCLSY